jgi:hypothetical protein
VVFAKCFFFYLSETVASEMLLRQSASGNRAHVGQRYANHECRLFEDVKFQNSQACVLRSYCTKTLNLIRM